MTDTDQQGNGAAAAATPPKVNMRILAQYMRDLSFENVAAQKKLQGGNVQPDIQVQVSLDAKKRETENQYEVGTKFKITSRNKTDGETLFLIELDYVGLFLIEGVPEGHAPLPADRMPAHGLPLRTTHHLGYLARWRFPAAQPRHGRFPGTLQAGTPAAGGAETGAIRRDPRHQLIGITAESPRRPAPPGVLRIQARA